MGWFDVGICTIFAREVLEGVTIIGQYRTVINACDDYKDKPEERQAALRAVRISSIIACSVAILIVIATAIPLILLSKSFNEKVIEIIEGVSKVVAAICLLQLSLKVPKWLGFYASKKVTGDELVSGLSLKSIKFNVAWNIWRETAEAGVFLVPYFLAGNAISIPASAAIGIVIGVVGGMLIYLASQRMKNKRGLAIFLAFVFGQLSVGLFTGGCHEFEEAWGETPKVWKIQGDFWSHKKLPFALIKPFGYSSSRTILQICCFWIWTALVLGAHYYKYTQSQKIFADRAAAKADQTTKNLDEFEEEP